MVQQNYFSDLNSAKILDLSAKPFFVWKYDKKFYSFVVTRLSRCYSVVKMIEIKAMDDFLS